jgi:hypothetical protein
MMKAGSPGHAKPRVIRALILSVALVVAARVWHVNDSSVMPPVEVRKEGEEVALDGALLDDANLEQTEGLVVTVTGCRLLSPDELSERYPAARELLPPGRQRSILCVTMRLSNEGVRDCRLNLGSVLAVTPDRCQYLVGDTSLWAAVEGVTGDSLVAGASLRSGDSCETCVPFTLNGGEERFQSELAHGTYRLQLSATPVRWCCDVVA